MPIRPDKRNIPTLAQGVERFLNYRRATNFKSIKDDISLLRGAEQRITGKKAAGTALARTELGNLRMDRLQEHEITSWFQQRHEGLASATRKRGMSTLRNFLAYSASQGWIDDSVLVACFTVADSEPRREWLHPEQVVALDALVQSPAFDDYQRFAWYVLLCTGVRSAELVSLRIRDLDPREQTLTVTGKGRGDGKTREIEVDDEFVQRWRDYARQYGLRPSDYVFFYRRMRFCGGVWKEMAWVEDRARPASAKPIQKFFLDLRDEVKKAEDEGRFDRELVPSFDLTPKVMRRTFACLALIADALSDEDGLDIRSLQLAMGHSSLEITARYLADVDRYLRRKRRRFNAMRAVELAVARGRI